MFRAVPTRASQAHHTSKGTWNVHSSRPRLISPPARLSCASLLLTLGLTPLSANAQTLITGVYTGTPGAPSTGNPDGNGNYFGISGGDGYDTNSGSYIVANAIITGGTGGAVAGAPIGANQIEGGFGGDGLSLFGYPSLNVIVNSGTFIGGIGGAATGTATNGVFGGQGGDGLIVLGGAGVSVVINDGTFEGGNAGLQTDTVHNSIGGGDGLDVDTYGSVTVNGGIFSGGNSSTEGFSSPALSDFFGSLNVHGGTFNSIGLYGGTTILYGSNFTVVSNGGIAMSNFTGAVPLGGGTITGTLENNGLATTFSYANFSNSPGTGLFIAAAPEPSQSAALGLGILGITALALCARRRAA